MSSSTPAELQASFATLSTRIAALDRDIALETDRERRTVAQAKRDELADERDRVAADMMVMGVVPQNTAHIEQRIGVLERDVKKLWEFVKPGPRQTVGRVVFFGLLALTWSMWMIKESRDWLIDNPAEAIVISLALVMAALIIRWLPEDDHDQR